MLKIIAILSISATVIAHAQSHTATEEWVTNRLRIARADMINHVAGQINAALTGEVTVVATTAASQTVALAINALPPAPTGVPVWISSNGTEFATLEPGPTGVLWRVSQVTLDDIEFVLLPGFRSLDPAVIPPLFRYPAPQFSDGLFQGNYQEGQCYITCAGSFDYWTGTYSSSVYPVYLVPSGETVAGTAIVDRVRGVATNAVGRLLTDADLALLMTAESLEVWWDSKQAFFNNLTNATLFGATKLQNVAPTNLFMRFYFSNDTLFTEHVIP